MPTPFSDVPELQPEQWPRWLPAPHSFDQHTHLAYRIGERAACGSEVMWAKPGHPATQRPRCQTCREVMKR